jgi:flagellar hook assembly protein FlgD
MSGSRMDISYPVSKAGVVRLAVYDAHGKLINTLVNERQISGGHRIVWMGQDNKRRQLSNGIYFMTLSLDNRMLKAERFVLIK